MARALLCEAKRFVPLVVGSIEHLPAGFAPGLASVPGRPVEVGLRLRLPAPAAARSIQPNATAEMRIVQPVLQTCHTCSRVRLNPRHGPRRRARIPPREPPWRARHQALARRHSAEPGDRNGRRGGPRDHQQPGDGVQGQQPAARSPLRSCACSPTSGSGPGSTSTAQPDIGSLPDAIEPLIDYYKGCGGSTRTGTTTAPAWCGSSAS